MYTAAFTVMFLMKLWFDSIITISCYDKVFRWYKNTSTSLDIGCNKRFYKYA